MNQVVNFPTHTAGHSLDLIFCRSHDSCNCLINCTKSDLLTDHFIITFTVILPLLPSLSKKLIHYRKIKSINIPLFSSELVSILVSLPISPESINSTLSLLLDKYAPIISTTISLHTNCPWFTPHLVKLKRSLRKTERTYRRMSSPENLLSFTNHRKFYKSQISKAKSSYYINKINSLSSNPRATFALARKLIAPDPPLHIPYIPNIPKNKLCNEFSNFFSNKILSTCSTITSLHQKYSIPCILISKPIDKYLSIFTTPSISNIYDLILKSNSSSPSDPINIYTVKSLASTLSPYLHTIFSSSLSNGVLPPSFKHAIITPILKKTYSNPNLLCNYRPISQLPIFSKILEKIVVHQINRFMSLNSSHDVLQSAFRKGHSTETALLQILNNIYTKVSPSLCCQMVLLDLSCAFDSLRHDILISRLEMIGINGSALKWLKSYILNRSSSVKFCDFFSDPRPLLYGVPQGSVLGPLLFSIYIAPIRSIIYKFPNVFYHIYADDIQLYSFLSVSTPDNSQLIACASSIKYWLLSNNLLLNTSKTAILNIPTNSPSFPSFYLDKILISPSNSVLNLGVIFDSDLSFSSHISKISKAANYHLFRIKCIRKHITRPLCAVLINSLVISRIDYCSSLLYILPASSIAPLNRIIRSSIRSIFNIKLSDHSYTDSFQIIPNWFPYRKRSLIRLLSITHKSIYFSIPSYIFDLLLIRSTTHNTRSTSSINLIIPQPSSLKFQKRSFSYIVPSIWNALPSSIRSIQSPTSFNSHLKSYLSSI